MIYLFEYLKLSLFKIFNISAGNKIKIAGYKVHFGSIRQLTLLYREIFIEENYKCNLAKSPYIIDGGANIGLAVLYFKKHYPDSKIVAFEPNPESFEYLKKNVESNNLKDVEIYNAALSNETGNISFYTSTDMHAADIGASAVKKHVNYYHANKGTLNKVSVSCLKLSPFVNKQVDLLKLDIEGFESKVIKEIKNNFSKVENSIMEYHYQFENPENALSDILEVLEENRHAYRVLAIESSKEVKNVSGYIIKSKKVFNKI